MGLLDYFGLKDDLPVPIYFTYPVAHGVYSILECAPLLTAILELNVAVTSYREINNEMLVNSDQINNCTEESRPDTTLKLKKWKSQHMLLYNNVVAWNDKMNWTLLIEICHFFFNFVIQSYYLIILISGGENYSTLFTYCTTMVIKHMIMLFVLCTSADVLKCEVRRSFQLIYFGNCKQLKRILSTIRPTKYPFHWQELNHRAHLFRARLQLIVSCFSVYKQRTSN